MVTITGKPEQGDFMGKHDYRHISDCASLMIAAGGEFEANLTPCLLAYIGY